MQNSPEQFIYTSLAIHVLRADFAEGQVQILKNTNQALSSEKEALLQENISLKEKITKLEEQLSVLQSPIKP